MMMIGLVEIYDRVFADLMWTKFDFEDGGVGSEPNRQLMVNERKIAKLGLSSVGKSISCTK